MWLPCSFLEQCFARRPWHTWGVGMSLLRMTFDFCHAPPLAWQETPNPGPSVNEVEDTGGIERLSEWERLVIVCGLCYIIVALFQWAFGGQSNIH